jgi:hypothetical protein
MVVSRALKGISPCAYLSGNAIKKAPDYAGEISTLIEAFVKAHETAELAERLDRLPSQ